MNAQWRLFVTALRFCTRLRMTAFEGGGAARAGDAGVGPAARFVPLAGMLIGAVGGGIYWLGALIWPASIAVVLSMLATALLCGSFRHHTLGAERTSGAESGVPAADAGVLGVVFAFVIKYNALMALSAAHLPFSLPANTALGLIMIAGHAGSRALVVSIVALPTKPASTPVSHGDLGIALATGFAPAALMGIPGLVGLATAIVARISYAAYRRRNRKTGAIQELDIIQQLTELCFYLGAIASWTYA